MCLLINRPLINFQKSTDCPVKILFSSSRSDGSLLMAVNSVWSTSVSSSYGEYSTYAVKASHRLKNKKKWRHNYNKDSQTAYNQGSWVRISLPLTFESLYITNDIQYNDNVKSPTFDLWHHCIEPMTFNIMTIMSSLQPLTSDIV